MLQLQRLLQCLLSSSVTIASASAAVLAGSSSNYPCNWNSLYLDLLQTCYRVYYRLVTEPAIFQCCYCFQHLLQCFPALRGSSSSYLCRWKSSCLDLLLTSATAIADLHYCFSSSICSSACRPLVLLLLLLLQHLLQFLLTLPSRDNASSASHQPPKTLPSISCALYVYMVASMATNDRRSTVQHPHGQLHRQFNLWQWDMPMQRFTMN